MKRELDPVLSQNSDEADNSVKSIEIKLKKTGAIPQFLRSSQSLTLKFQAIVRSGYFKQFQTLSIFYTIINGQKWQNISGQISGVSQMSYSPDGQIVWNFPIEIVYQTNSLENPPQIVFVLYGHDFFGRNIPRAYGNIHFPLSEGTSTRKVRTFKVNQYSFLTRIYSLVTGSYYEFKEIQKVLNASEQRANLKAQTCGAMNIQFQTKRFNFQKYGYDN